MKKCSQCRFWVKVQSMKGSCDLHDYGWTPSDNRACKDFASRKYSRSQKTPTKQYSGC